MCLKFVLFFCFCLVNCFNCETINVGGIFEEDEINEKAFKYAIESINAQEDQETKLNPITKNIPTDDAYTSSVTTCDLISSGVLGVFGTTSQENSDGIQSVCDLKEIPHILTKWITKPPRGSTIINFHPNPVVLCRAFFDLIIQYEWKSFTFLFEDHEGLTKMMDVLKFAEHKDINVVIRELDELETGSYRSVWKEIWRSGQKNFVIDCKYEHLREVLLHAQQVGLMTQQFNYIITNLDMHTIDLTPFQYSETNITGMRLVNPESKLVETISNEFFGSDSNLLLIPAAWQLRTETALIIDAVNMFYSAIADMATTSNFLGEEINCNTTNSWANGLSVINLMKSNAHLGLSGVIRFDHEGYRSDFELDVIDVLEGGVIKSGTWNTTGGLNVTAPSFINYDYGEDSLVNRSFVVITCLTEPYGMLKKNSMALTGNDQFEGYAIDLIKMLAEMEGFKYTFKIREDKSNGALLENGSWSGMIGDVVEHRADLAITDLTITSERRSGVDFTSPFMNLGISILFKKPTKAPPNFFSFAEPFAVDTWMGLALSFFVVSMSLYLVGRMCPDEWQNPYPCIEEPEYLVNQFSLKNAFWFSVGSLMQQGTEIAPIAISTRMIAGMWYFFILIMVSSYTANLAAFLATENPNELFTDVESLVENAEKYNIRFGAKRNGSTANFFRDSVNNELYQKIYEHMNTHLEDMPKENDLGVSLAEKEQYAFFMESTSIQYVTQRHCNLTMYGKLLDDKGYGIAMRKDSPYRQKLSTAILKLQSSGKLDSLKIKWWQEKRGGGQCSDESESADATPLNLKNVEGVFYVTIYGTIGAMLLVILEMLISTFRISRKVRISMWAAFKKEMKFFLNFDNNVKPVLARKSHSLSKSKSKSKSVLSKGSKNDENNEVVRPYGFVPEMSKKPSENSENNTQL